VGALKVLLVAAVRLDAQMNLSIDLQVKLVSSRLPGVIDGYSYFARHLTCISVKRAMVRL